MSGKYRAGEMEKHEGSDVNPYKNASLEQGPEYADYDSYVPQWE